MLSYDNECIRCFIEDALNNGLKFVKVAVKMFEDERKDAKTQKQDRREREKKRQTP